MKTVFLDVETIGFHGIAITFQYAIDDGPVEIYYPFDEPVGKTMELLNSWVDATVVAFNGTFDWFHIVKWRTMLEVWFNKYADRDVKPLHFISEFKRCELPARDAGCFKPANFIDVMLLARKGAFQNTMKRSDIYIRKVPIKLAYLLAEELEKRIDIDPIMFERRKVWAPTWKVEPLEDDDSFANIICRFAPSSALKSLARHALGEEVTEFNQLSHLSTLDDSDTGYNPTGDWHLYVNGHNLYWKTNSQAIKYAKADVDYLRRLWKLFGSSLNDDDSNLVPLVANCRWRGYRVDLEGIAKVRSTLLVEANNAPIAPNDVRRFIEPHLSPMEKDFFTSTDKETLEAISKWPDHPAAEKARQVLQARTALKRIDILNKLKTAGRFHASFKITGTLSNRMSGTDSLNSQGIPREKQFRSLFPLAWEDQVLSGGDFASFEVAIAEAVYNDASLRRDMLTCSKCANIISISAYLENKCNHCGADKDPVQKIHGLFAMDLFPGHTYQQIEATKKTSNDLYSLGKSGVFAMIYGGNAATLNHNLGIPKDVAEVAMAKFAGRYPGIGKKRNEIVSKYAALSQEGGIGTKITWTDPCEYVESLLGFRRYFTFEIKIMKALYELANNPPLEWLRLKDTVKRRDRFQTTGGATRTALFAAAFGISGSIQRAAGNHEIQSTGAQINKKVQLGIWGLQPVGFHPWVVQPMNIHDENMVPNNQPERVANIVHDIVEESRSIVPLIKIDWERKLNSWADK